MIKVNITFEELYPTLTISMILRKSIKVKKKGSRISKTRAREGGASVFTFFLFLKAAAPAKRAIQQAGKKEGGWGEGIFARLLKRSPSGPARLPRSELRSTTGVESRAKQKNFLFLLEEKKIGALKFKKAKEIFLRGTRAERAAAGRSVSFVQRRFAHFQTKGTTIKLSEILPTDFAARSAAE